MDNMTPDTTLALLQTTQADTAKAAGKVKNIKSSVDIEKVEAAAKEFEAVFIAEMMKPMFEGISTNGEFGGGKGEEIFRGMLLQEYGNLMAQTGAVGIASEVKNAMIQMQNEADGIDPLSIEEMSTEQSENEIAVMNGESNATSP